MKNFSEAEILPNTLVVKTTDKIDILTIDKKRAFTL